MTDRDFKLLVRRYFHAKVAVKIAELPKVAAAAILIQDDAETKIKAELSRFTQQEIEGITV